jgi:hypothetical protein
MCFKALIGEQAVPLKVEAADDNNYFAVQEFKRILLTGSDHPTLVAGVGAVYVCAQKHISD